VQLCVAPLLEHADSISTSMEGERCFIHRLTLPATAGKQLEEILPFELEAQVPVDIDDLVYDFLRLRRTHASGSLNVIAAAARIEHVRERVEWLGRVLLRQPDRVGCGPLPLANLALLSPALMAPGPIALVDLGARRTEVVVLAGGEPVLARTLSRGTEGLPESAPRLLAELRQTFAAWGQQGGAAPERVYLVGGGAAAQGAEAHLAHELGIAVEPLPAPSIEGLSPERQPLFARFAKATALAASMMSRAKGLDLRQGPLAYTRGYGFLKERIPLLSGLGAAIFISFVFSTWAEMRALSRDQEVLTETLSAVSKSVVGKETTDPDEALSLLTRLKQQDEPDPMPRMDAFDVLVELSNAISLDVVHDIEEFDFHREHVKVNGVISSTAEAQGILNLMKEHRCVVEPKISKITQAINSDRQKYVMEFDVKCPEEQKKQKKKSPDGASETGP
jgi:general secretion pathway protein L